MASRYYGINKGQRKTDVVEGSSTNSTGIELVVDLAAIAGDGQAKRDILNALEYLKQYIINKAKFPPA